jgi:hypothetical protein
MHEETILLLQTPGPWHIRKEFGKTNDAGYTLRCHNAVSELTLLYSSEYRALCKTEQRSTEVSKIRFVIQSIGVTKSVYVPNETPLQEFKTQEGVQQMRAGCLPEQQLNVYPQRAGRIRKDQYCALLRNGDIVQKP